MSSPITKMTNIKNLSIRAESYGFPGVTIDGNNLLDVMEAAEKAVHRARSGKGPTLIEAKTYRFNGHSKSDKELYRSAEEVEERRKKDPIMRFERFLLQDIEIDEREMLQIKQKIQKEVKAATVFALESKEPSLEELFTDVYA